MSTRRSDSSGRPVPGPGLRNPVTVPPGVGFVGAGNVLWAYLQVLDRLVPRASPRRADLRAPDGDVGRPSPAPSRSAARLREEVVEADVDVVVVLTPPATHAELARLALEHGKHVVWRSPSRRAARKVKRLPWPQREACSCSRRRSSSSLPRSGRSGRSSAMARWATSTRRGPLRERRLALGGVVPLGRARAAGRGRHLQPQEPDGAPRAGHRGARSRGDRRGRARGRRRRDRCSDPDVSHAVLRHAGGALSSRRLEPGHPALPSAGARALRHRGYGQPVGDDWDPRGFEVWRNDEGALGGARGDRADVALGRRAARGRRRCRRGALRSPASTTTSTCSTSSPPRASRWPNRSPVVGRLVVRPTGSAATSCRRALEHLHDHTRPADEQ